MYLCLEGMVHLIGEITSRVVKEVHGIIMTKVQQEVGAMQRHLADLLKSRVTWARARRDNGR